MDPDIFTKTLGNKKIVDQWNEALLESKAIIAGGAVLAPYANYGRNDLDIYVGKENLVTLCNMLIPLGVKSMSDSEVGLDSITTAKEKLCFSSGYDKSFFRKNHLLARLRFSMPRHYEVGDVISLYQKVPLGPKGEGWSTYVKVAFQITQINKDVADEENPDLSKIHLEGIYDSALNYTPPNRTEWSDEIAGEDKIDIIVVDTDKATVESVVTNFDLSFCEIWYNGKDIQLGKTSPQEIEKKQGRLQGEYVQSLIDGNSFITDRLAKYKKRGFSIALDAEGPFSYYGRPLAKVNEENYGLWTSYFLYEALLISTATLITQKDGISYDMAGDIKLGPLLKLMSTSTSPGNSSDVLIETGAQCLATLLYYDPGGVYGYLINIIDSFASSTGASRIMEAPISPIPEAEMISQMAKKLASEQNRDILKFYATRAIYIHMATFMGRSPLNITNIAQAKFNYQEMYDLMRVHTPSSGFAIPGIKIPINETPDVPSWTTIISQSLQIALPGAAGHGPPMFGSANIPRPYNIKSALEVLAQMRTPLREPDVERVRIWLRVTTDLDQTKLEDHLATEELDTESGPPEILDLTAAVQIIEEEKQSSAAEKMLETLAKSLQEAMRAGDRSTIRQLMAERAKIQAQQQGGGGDSGPKGVPINQYNNQRTVDRNNFGFFTFVGKSLSGEYEAWGCSIGRLLKILSPVQYKNKPQRAVVEELFAEFFQMVSEPQSYPEDTLIQRTTELLNELVDISMPDLSSVFVKCGRNAEGGLAASDTFPSFNQMDGGEDAEWYAKVDISPSYRSCIPYATLKAIILAVIKGYRVFMVSEDTNLEEVSTIANLSMGGPAIDLAWLDINTVSGTHCNNVARAYKVVKIFLQPNGEPPSFAPLGSAIPFDDHDEEKSEGKQDEEKVDDNPYRNVTTRREANIQLTPSQQEMMAARGLLAARYRNVTVRNPRRQHRRSYAEDFDITELQTNVIESPGVARQLFNEYARPPMIEGDVIEETEITVEDDNGNVEEAEEVAIVSPNPLSDDIAPGNPVLSAEEEWNLREELITVDGYDPNDITDSLLEGCRTVSDCRQWLQDNGKQTRFEIEEGDVIIEESLDN